MALYYTAYGLPRWSWWKNLPANAGNIRDAESIPGWGRFLGRAYGNPLHYSCLENPMDKGAWRVTVHRVAKIQAWLKWINMHACKTYQELEPVIGRNDRSVAEGWVWTSLRLKTPKGPIIGRPLYFHEFQFQELISEEKFPLVLERRKRKAAMLKYTQSLLFCITKPGPQGKRPYQE